MSRAPFRRAARNLAAAALIWPGTALVRWSLAAMWPDDRPRAAEEVTSATVWDHRALDHDIQLTRAALGGGSEDAALALLDGLVGYRTPTVGRS